MKTTNFENKPPIWDENEYEAYILLNLQDFVEAFSDTANNILYIDRRGDAVCEIYCDFIDYDECGGVKEMQCYYNGNRIAAFCLGKNTVYFQFRQVLYVLRG